MSVEAQVAFRAVVHDIDTGGPFPSALTFPAFLDEILAAEGTKYCAKNGEIGEDPIAIDLSNDLETVTHWIVQNLASIDEDGEANVVVSGGPADGTVARGDMTFATNRIDGWDASVVTLTGTTGTPYKIIAIGR